MARIVVAEDDALQQELLHRYLTREGHDVVIASDGPSALAQAREADTALLVLDVMLPGLDGLQVCSRLREEGSELPVIMLTARSSEADVLIGLDVGADDYVIKPYRPRELVARTRTQLRRTAARRQERQLRAGDVVVDAQRHEALLRGRVLDLTRAEFALLHTLLRNRGIVLSRQQLLEGVHGDGRFITERTVDAHVKNLRTKLEDDPRRPRYVQTVYGVGYRFDGFVDGADAS
ncbi:response regulator transcription factor [Kineococcus sp. NBC_00420]|uniref:response regulator transcription factor n=1 Tax=Kineococcus sp. NBC_00420 TaxID=2903564 RepID=UPI002E1D32A0